MVQTKKRLAPSSASATAWSESFGFSESGITELLRRSSFELQTHSISYTNRGFRCEMSAAERSSRGWISDNPRDRWNVSTLKCRNAAQEAVVFGRVKGSVDSHVHEGRLAGGCVLAGWRRSEGTILSTPHTFC